MFIIGPGYLVFASFTNCYATTPEFHRACVETSRLNK